MRRETGTIWIRGFFWIECSNWPHTIRFTSTYRPVWFWKDKINAKDYLSASLKFSDMNDGSTSSALSYKFKSPWGIIMLNLNFSSAYGLKFPCTSNYHLSLRDKSIKRINLFRGIDKKKRGAYQFEQVMYTSNSRNFFS